MRNLFVSKLIIATMVVALALSGCSSAKHTNIESVSSASISSSESESFVAESTETSVETESEESETTEELEYVITDVSKTGRNGCTELAEFALSQVGNSGDVYWKSYGFNMEVPWSACFVEYCMRNVPQSNDAYPTRNATGNNAHIKSVANWFRHITNKWGNNKYSDLVAGDVIFFDWQNVNEPTHIGIVIGTDGSAIYTVEGDVGDTVRLRKYKIGAECIHGYGLLEYSADEDLESSESQ